MKLGKSEVGLQTQEVSSNEFAMNTLTLTVETKLVIGSSAQMKIVVCGCTQNAYISVMTTVFVEPSSVNVQYMALMLFWNMNLCEAFARLESACVYFLLVMYP